MQAATDAQTVAPGEAPSTSANGTIEREIGVSGRSLLVQPGMPFPSVLLTQGREADVVVRIRIRADGSIAQTEVTQPSGDSRVDVAVESVVREYLFNSVEGGTIGEGTVTFHFRLKRGF
jgi:TonB family protein